MSGASKEGNREKHFRLWKALEKEVERLEKGGRERAPIMIDLKKVVLKEIWGGREVLLMGEYSYCYACKEATKRALSDQGFTLYKCTYCPIMEEGGYRRLCDSGDIYHKMCEYYMLGYYKECLNLIREFLLIPWVERSSE